MTWSFLNKPSQKSEKTEITLSPLEVDIARCFSTPEGIKCLEAIKKLTIESANNNIHQDGMNTAIAMALKEGENNLCRKIIAIINKNK